MDRRFSDLAGSHRRNHQGPYCAAIIGLDPFQIEKAWELHRPRCPRKSDGRHADRYRHVRHHGKGPEDTAYTTYLGGIFRDKVPTASIIGFGETEAMVKECQEWLDLGVKAMRIKVGLGLKKDLINTEAIRKTIGDEVTLRIDCNQAFTRHDAVRVINALDAFTLELVEQPVPWWDLTGMGMVRPFGPCARSCPMSPFWTGSTPFI